jgi:hypothetical protein
MNDAENDDDTDGRFLAELYILCRKMGPSFNIYFRHNGGMLPLNACSQAIAEIDRLRKIEEAAGDALKQMYKVSAPDAEYTAAADALDEALYPPSDTFNPVTALYDYPAPSPIRKPDPTMEYRTEQTNEPA